METMSEMLDEYIDSLCDCLGSLYAGGNLLKTSYEKSSK